MGFYSSRMQNPLQRERNVSDILEKLFPPVPIGDESEEVNQPEAVGSGGCLEYRFPSEMRRIRNGRGKHRTRLVSPDFPELEIEFYEGGFKVSGRRFQRIPTLGRRMRSLDSYWMSVLEDAGIPTQFAGYERTLGDIFPKWEYPERFFKDSLILHRLDFVSGGYCFCRDRDTQTGLPCPIDKVRIRPAHRTKHSLQTGEDLWRAHPDASELALRAFSVLARSACEHGLEVGMLLMNIGSDCYGTLRVGGYNLCSPLSSVIYDSESGGRIDLWRLRERARGLPSLKRAYSLEAGEESAMLNAFDKMIGQLGIMPEV